MGTEAPVTEHVKQALSKLAEFEAAERTAETELQAAIKVEKAAAEAHAAASEKAAAANASMRETAPDSQYFDKRVTIAREKQNAADECRARLDAATATRNAAAKKKTEAAAAIDAATARLDELKCVDEFSVEVIAVLQGVNRFSAFADRVPRMLRAKVGAGVLARLGFGDGDGLATFVQDFARDLTAFATERLNRGLAIAAQLRDPPARVTPPAVEDLPVDAELRHMAPRVPVGPALPGEGLLQRLAEREDVKRRPLEVTGVSVEERRNRVGLAELPPPPVDERKRGR